jgi:hypothetical protein
MDALGLWVVDNKVRQVSGGCGLIGGGVFAGWMDIHIGRLL